MNQETWNQIRAVIQASIQALPAGPAGPQGPQGAQGLPGHDGMTAGTGESRPVVINTAEDIGFSDPGYEDPSNSNAMAPWLNIISKGAFKRPRTMRPRPLAGECQ